MKILPLLLPFAASGRHAASAFSLRMASDSTVTTQSARLPTPSRIKKTQNWREAAALSSQFRHEPTTASTKKKVAIIGGGLSGLACAKYLADAGHAPTVYEARGVLGGKVSAWQDDDGDWIETGLHIFFGAYPHMMNLFEELEIEERLQWKEHRMTFAMQELPGRFTSFEFPAGVPAPFNMAAAILTNTEMLTLEEKLRMVPGLLPMLLEGQSFIDAQDELSVVEFMKKYGMPERINEEIFVAMGKALDFTDPDKLSMSVILTAMNRFINEADGSQTAFLDGNQPERLCQPLVEHITARGGAVRTGTPIASIEVDPADGAVTRLLLADGTAVEADVYVSAMPVDVLKRLIPARWSPLPYFRQLAELEGIPVLNLQLWFDRKLRSVDGLCFSRSPLLSVYADMSTCCAEHASDTRSMLELVFAPATEAVGADRNWLAASDEEIVDATLGELERLFPTEIGPEVPGGGAQVLKSTVVRVPRSVYATTPGRNKFRPGQASPIPNFFVAGDFAAQKYLGSMEGAVLSGKLATKAVCDAAAGRKRGEV
mmetsp:Transcript_46288/g.90373  ORF Transcript_46288/g.90373 Transcript_46288/m.90373 type:complete len:543 (-) Transcript_46288:377-2005(-)